MKYQRTLSMKPPSGTNTADMARILSLLERGQLWAILFLKIRSNSNEYGIKWMTPVVGRYEVLHTADSCL
jgi:hypothetical protein